jgi:hypothetical protein
MNLKKKTLAAERYNNPLFKKMKDYEEFVDEEFIEDSILYFEEVVWIKDNSSFFNYGDGRLNAMIDRFEQESGFSIQYVCVEKDIWLGVIDKDRICRGDYDESYVPIEEHNRKLDRGCRAIEAFAKQIDSNASVFARVCKKEDLLGKFVMEICDIDKYDDSKLSSSDLKKIKVP